MANASAKRIAAQNEKAIRNLRVGMIVCMGLSITIRLFLRRYTFSSIFSIMVYVTTLAPSMFLYSFLVRAGTPRRDASGMLLSPGDDLNQAGLTDWSWDIIYVTWACQVGSSLFGEWVWWLYLVIPLYAGYRAWTSFISPMLLGRSSALGAGDAKEGQAHEPASKRQDKLRKRQEKGDIRVRSVATNR
ncbi:hypothetical protein JB92DRAFT_2896295 [Gautieria morchelliformis]|nr:hypothetical protein JB92DRAFT_2896295 [Gautieria morchelliformis]